GNPVNSAISGYSGLDPVGFRVFDADFGPRHKRAAGIDDFAGHAGVELCDSGDTGEEEGQTETKKLFQCGESLLHTLLPLPFPLGSANRKGCAKSSTWRARLKNSGRTFRKREASARITRFRRAGTPGLPVSGRLLADCLRR